MSTHRCACGARLLSAEEVGRTPASARKEMTWAGISEARGYPTGQVRSFAVGHSGKGRWGHE
jgi:hypothetical protein